MPWVEIIAPLIPSIALIIKDAVDASKGDEQVAIGILMGVLGTSEENKTRAAMVLAKLKAMEALGPK